MATGSLEVELEFSIKKKVVPKLCALEVERKEKYKATHVHAHTHEKEHTHMLKKRTRLRNSKLPKVANESRLVLNENRLSSDLKEVCALKWRLVGLLT